MSEQRGKDLIQENMNLETFEVKTSRTQEGRGKRKNTF